MHVYMVTVYIDSLFIRACKTRLWMHANCPIIFHFWTNKLTTYADCSGCIICIP